MDKYGVVTDETEDKQASDSLVCPHCGACLEDTNVLKCPNCGTRPFEQATDDSEDKG